MTYGAVSIVGRAPIKRDNQDAIWVKIKKELSREENDIYIGTYYLNQKDDTETSTKM